ncbi:hypothetical protein CNMCM5793_008691 [Aspergillus hiratsukae]|uniref:Uncharacterized protein n=1 Tax=Aspergillus hiratsukae TaxID=1194566 RepID=A0A8H6PRV8_9EURO|nr:hypothetical protein CNMCM5793_008691 [Aspergillus hiratsukae]KAF7159743.1 hypothetical protein CNMCM6106_007145 [Aspergillus hiratsukae]
MSKEPRETAPPVEDSDSDSTPHPHPTIRLHTTNTNTNTNTNGAMTGYSHTENKTNALDIHQYQSQYPPRRRSLLLSDSEISVLDLGPSLEFEVGLEAEGEEGASTLRLSAGKLGYGHCQRDCSQGSRREDGKLGPGSQLAVPGRKVSIEESTGGAAVRIISSPLLSPLRTTKKGNSGRVRGRESNADKGGEGKRLEEG